MCGRLASSLTKLWFVKATDFDNDILTDQVFAFFRQAEHDTKGEWTVKDIHNGLKDRSLAVFAAVDGETVLCCACVGILQFANMDRIGRFWFCVALPNTMPEWVHHFETIMDWMRDEGCSRVDGRFRKGWVRVLRKCGLRDTHAVCEMEL